MATQNIKSQSVRRLIGGFTFLMVVFSLAWAACDATDDKPAAADAVASSDVSVGMPLVGHGTYNGAVVIRTVDQLRVVVSVDVVNEEGETDGLIDRIFTLQGNDPLRISPSNEFDNATVTLAHGNLYIDPSDSRQGFHLQAINFDLSDADKLSHGDRVALSSVSQTVEHKTIVGFGLAQRRLAEADQFEISRARDLTEYVPFDSEDCALSQPFKILRTQTSQGRAPNCQDGNCPAGGPGSTSCSNGECSVSCGTGYSCCQGSACICCGAG